MLLTKTTELGIQCLVYFALRKSGRANLVTPQEVAEALDASPTYLSKVLRDLTKAGILESRRGASGGFRMVQDPEHINLRMVVEACQGAVAGNYCKVLQDPHKTPVCGYHRAMLELQEEVRRSLEKWTIRALIEAPPPCEEDPGECKMSVICRSVKMGDAPEA